MDKVVVLIKRSDYKTMCRYETFTDIQLKLFSATLAEGIKGDYELIIYDKISIKRPKGSWRLDILSNEDGLIIRYPEKVKKVVFIGNNIPMKCYEIDSIEKVALSGNTKPNDKCLSFYLTKYFDNSIHASWKVFARDILSINPKITFSEPNLLKHIKTLHSLYVKEFVKLTGLDRKKYTEAVIEILKIIRPTDEIEINKLLVREAIFPIVENRFDKNCGYNTGLLSILMSMVVLENIARTYTPSVKSGLIKSISLTELEKDNRIWLGVSLGYSYNILNNFKEYFPAILRLIEKFGSIPRGVVYTIDLKSNSAKNDCVYYMSKHDLSVINLLTTGDMIVLY